MKITTLLFDLDGTLVDSARESAVILNAMRNERGRGPCDISLFQEKISSGAKGLIECALGFCKEDTESLIKEFRAKYQTTQTPKSSLYPNVIETLTQLRTIGYSLGVVTNKPDNLCHNVLIQTGLFQFFDCIIAATGNIKPKPHPEPIHTALQKMGRKKNESILIGDSRPDQLAAAQAGIPFIFFTEGYDDGVNQADVFASISHHQDLLTKKLFLSLPLAGKTKQENAMSDQDISAVIQPRIYSAPKAPLEDRVPLSTPLSAHIDVCSLCNFKCSFCFQADNQAMKEANLQRGFMPVDLFKKIVDDLAEFDEKLKKIKIGNHGEPTMHPDLPEMVAYARQKDVAEVIELFTNASKLNPQLNQAIINAGMQRINISLEGLTSERYMQVAGVRQDMQQLIDAIAHLHSISKDCQIYVKIADQTSSLDKTDHTIHVMNDEERQYFLDTFGNICDEIYIEKIVPQWAETQAEKQNDVNETGMYHQKIKKYKEVCPFTFMYLHFNCDGTTSPCTLDWPRKVVIGNVKEQSAKEIWEGESLHNLRVAMLRDARNRINFCKNCSAPMVCVDEDFDPYKEKVLKAINADNDISLKNNEWVSDNDK